MSLAFGILSSLAIQAPVIGVWLVGIVLALRALERQPRVARLVLLSLAILVIQNLIWAPLSRWLPLALVQQDVSPGEMAVYFSALGLVNSLIAAVAWALLLVALFRRINASG